jgi:hypothetical protein
MSSVHDVSAGYNTLVESDDNCRLTSAHAHHGDSDSEDGYLVGRDSPRVFASFVLRTLNTFINNQFEQQFALIPGHVLRVDPLLRAFRPCHRTMLSYTRP